MKTCSKCKDEKPRSEFSPHKLTSDGLNSWCRACVNLAVNASNKTRSGLVRKIYGNQRFSSKRRGHPMPTYTKEDLCEWVYSQPNFEVLYQNWVKSGYDKSLIPSVDRRDDYVGYTIDNLLRVCTWGENRDRNHADRKNGVNNKMSKAIRQLTLEGNLVKEHYSARSAARAVGAHQSNIWDALNGRSEYSAGYKWEYAVKEALEIE